MSEPRLATSLWVGALVRRIHSAGDFATVLYRGDAIAGSVALIHRRRDGSQDAYLRVMGPAGTMVWTPAPSGESIAGWITRQRSYDPDLWVLELDTADLTRFVEEMTV